jgi:hypothetical protein
MRQSNVSFDPANGYISFRIDGVGAAFNQNMRSQRQFVFEGRYDPLVPPFLSGRVKAQDGFGLQWNGTGESREDAHWASKPLYRPVGQAIKMRRNSV